MKDRPARQMILEAEKRGDIKPGGLVVEGTAGNTGIGLALVANARGYRTLIVIPEHAEPGKEGHAAAVRRRADRGAGAALQQSEQLPARRAPPRRPAAQDREERRAVRRPVEQPRQPQGALSSRPGRKSGSRPTARSTASSARSAPAARSPARRIYLREKNKDIVIGCADPRGAAMYNLFAHRRGQGHRGRLDHRRHRARPRHADHRRHQGRQGLSRFPTRRRCR